MLVVSSMRIHVYVTPKKTVLDPQGQTIRRALNSMGHPEIENVRQGKFFEVEVADRLSPEEATQVMKKIAEEVLSNPVIEEYRVEMAR
jgi:phosphoribosylformylglycinamidine synthase PurS subunit